MSDYPPYKAPLASWTFMNDVEPAADGQYYDALFQYREYGVERLTEYDLTREVSVEVCRSRNEALGLEEDYAGLWYRPEPGELHGGIYWRETTMEDFYA